VPGSGEGVGREWGGRNDQEQTTGASNVFWGVKEGLRGGYEGWVLEN